MVDLAIKILAVIGGLVAAFASYPYLNQYVLAILAFFGAIAVGIIAGALLFYVLSWALSGVRNKV